MEEQAFINEISRRFPEREIKFLEDAIDTCIGTEYEYIFSREIKELICLVD
tara:strand:+ start:25389 stop:25541 length:153 start_codon:yes stop_codon:yes gene_type:complete